MTQIIYFYKEIINKIGIEYTIKYLIIVIGIVLIYARVIRNFKDARKQKNQKKLEVKSIVETVSMTGFFILIYFVVILKLGIYNYHNIILDIISTIIYIIGIIFNLLVYIISLTILKRIIKKYKKQIQIIMLLHAVISMIAFILILYRKEYNDIGSISSCVGILSSYLTLCIKKYCKRKTVGKKEDLEND